MESCHLDADLDYESIPIFTQKESLEAFLPSRVVALVNVVELIDQFAMTPKEAAVEAAREGNVERVRCFLDDLDFDIASVVTTAAEYGQNEVIDMISISPALGAKMLVRAIRKEQFGVVNFLWGQSWI
ncbi:hypothetical protein C6341_g12442 [Phytophthora cactorum]|nr:hypothetical protein C6341_g12442 [Phytophthora cactorum]